MATGCGTLADRAGPPVPGGATGSPQPTSVGTALLRPAWLESLLWPGRAEWRDWAATQLQTGDLVFVRSNYYLMLGTFNLSRFLAEVGQSPFSHVGLVIVEDDGRPMVYDITDRGIHSQPFAEFLTSGAKQRVAVRRPIGAAQAAVGDAVRYVRDRQRSGVTFDRRFESGDERLYCTELIVEAYRQGGVELAAATPVGELPGLDDVSPTKRRLVQLATGLDADDPVLLPGNAHSGLYGSTWLRTVLEPTAL